MNVLLFCCSAFIQEFRNWESAWALEALYALAYEIRVLAERVWNLVLFDFFFQCVFGRVLNWSVGVCRLTGNWLRMGNRRRS